MPSQPGKPISVSRLLALLKQSVSRTFSQIVVAGEVLDPILSQRGHLYFRLRDGQSEIRAVMWRREVQELSRVPQAGDKVTVRASLDIYASRGDLQLVVLALMQSGKGQKLLELAQLRATLKVEGLLDRERRPLPFMPRVIGVVTSVGSAVIHDIYQTIQKRCPRCQILLSPTSVSGEGAAAELVQALEKLRGRCDVVIVGRGGGSFEELLPFSDEALVRVAADFEVPVVAAVGHGSDITILDLVADHTAPTPTAAAVLVTPDGEELRAQVAALRRTMTASLQRTLDFQRGRLVLLRKACRAYHPFTRVKARREETDEAVLRLQRALTLRLRHERGVLESFKRGLEPRLLVRRMEQSRNSHAAAKERLVRAGQNTLERSRRALGEQKSRLKASGPRSILERGFVLVDSENGIITSAKGRTVGEELELHFADGRITVEVKSIKNDKRDTP